VTANGTSPLAFPKIMLILRSLFPHQNSSKNINTLVAAVLLPLIVDTGAANDRSLSGHCYHPAGYFDIDFAIAAIGSLELRSQQLVRYSILGDPFPTACCRMSVQTPSSTVHPTLLVYLVCKVLCCDCDKD
jgi:hypothetical protein